ncbi:cytochrome c oxidase subunit II [Cesiribacter andamanensis]|uniref:Cytochrome c oxidase subunit 2 n=1 Tax=Cesiribacter andamanensis AMV16 TaxID=1279009 RepID=M7NX64_9BACT|nr:cytochrome c oxidase subunit II [Cesiribacter andamanensis]EMR03034.1 Cytochrome c oxidase subunit 2 precursor [Cesiribacter andamanensis AMV16]
MFGILITIGVLILLAILMLLYRVYTLVSVARGTDKIKVSASNKINAILFLVFMILCGGLFFWYSFDAYENYQTPFAAAHGEEYESLFWATMWVSVAAFLITNVALFFFAFRYQYKEGAKALFYPDNTKLEIVWTIIPAIILVTLVFGGFKVWNQMTDESPEDAVELEIMGYQFAWVARYPGNDGVLGKYDFRLISPDNQMGLNLDDVNSHDDFMPREIHIPKGRAVEIKIRARDVLHSVSLPHFRQKMDAMPGMPTRMWFIPTKTTAEMREETGNPDFNYELACQQICGRGHFSMKMIVVVDEPADYEKWVAEQQSWTDANPELLGNRGGQQAAPSAAQPASAENVQLEAGVTQ